VSNSNRLFNDAHRRVHNFPTKTFQVPVDFEKLVAQRPALNYEIRLYRGHAYVFQVHEHEKHQNYYIRIVSVQYGQPQYVSGQYNGQIQNGQKQMVQRAIAVFSDGRR